MNRDIILKPNSLSELAAAIKAEHEAIKGLLADSLTRAMAAGDWLLEAKRKVKHGDWLPWLRDNVEISERTAQAYMRCANNRIKIEEMKSAAPADLTIEDALGDLAKPRLEITADYTIISNGADLLPEQGRVQIGTLEHGYGCGKTLEIFGITESAKYPGYYDVAHIEMIGDDADDGYGAQAQLRKPIRADHIRFCLAQFTRYPNLIVNIDWNDQPASFWPFAPATRGGGHE